MMLKKHGKLLMNLFLQNLKKNKAGGETYNADLTTRKTAVFAYLEGQYPSIDATLFKLHKYEILYSKKRSVFL